jgi:hypothetical protein
MLNGATGAMAPGAVDAEVVFLGGLAARDGPLAEGLARTLGRPVANLGAANAGPDYYLARAQDLKALARSRAAVVQITGADRLSNPFYTVHPRRNDRFLAATPALTRLFPGVDLTEIHFTRHLLMVLEAADPRAFAQVQAGLQAAWTARMRQLLRLLPKVRVLVALPEGGGQTGPKLVTTGMLDALQPEVSAVICDRPDAGPLQDRIARALG